MKLANPNQSVPFDEVTKDVNGQDEYGYRKLEDGTDEIVHIPTSVSNTQYHQPEKVTHFEGCNHSFRFLSIGRREVECEMCHFTTSFHVSDFKEEGNRGYVKVNKTEYPVLFL